MWQTVVFGCGAAAEAVLIILLIKVRLFRSFPIFFLYFCWGILNDLSVYLILVKLHYSSSFSRIYLIQLLIDSILMFSVLVEIAWSVLRPMRASLPKRSLLGIITVIAIACLLLWPIAGFTVPASASVMMSNIVRIQQTSALLRVVFFLVLAACSQLLSIGWRDRELQIATGLGTYSLVSFAITILHTHQIFGTQHYFWLDEIGGTCFLGVLIYWIAAFATKEAERREITPQMQNFLLAAAGTARATRLALMKSRIDSPREQYKK